MKTPSLISNPSGWAIIPSMEQNLLHTTWRLILSEPLPGEINMARDSAILAAVENEQVPPTLCLYRWDPPCLSLGYSQPASDVDLNRMAQNGWDLVRRPTGGRAILHTDELTYAVIGPRSEPRLAGSLMDSYRRLSGALFQALRSLGLPVEVHHGKNPLASQQPVCFENPSDFEITVQGRKIIGSAQARTKGGILQHGSLPLGGDLTRITQVLNYRSSQARNTAAQELTAKARTVSQVLGQEVTWEAAAMAFQSAFEDVLNLDLEPGQLTPAERDTMEELIHTRYGNADWNMGKHLNKQI